MLCSYKTLMPENGFKYLTAMKQNYKTTRKIRTDFSHLIINLYVILQVPGDAVESSYPLLFGTQHHTRAPWTEVHNKWRLFLDKSAEI